MVIIVLWKVVVVCIGLAMKAGNVIAGGRENPRNLSTVNALQELDSQAF